jgi:hypothetical protein
MIFDRLRPEERCLKGQQKIRSFSKLSAFSASAHIVAGQGRTEAGFEINRERKEENDSIYK